MNLQTIPTKHAVKAHWESYQRLVLAVRSDPTIASDPAMQWALDRAHQRWAKAFSEWDGR